MTHTRGAIGKVLRHLAMVALTAAAFTIALTTGPAKALDLQRFVNLTTWFTWPRYVGIDQPGFQRPVFDPAKIERGRAALKDIKSMGFRGVRIGVDPSPFWLLEGTEREQAISLVMQGVRAALDGGLDVVLDLHPNSRHQIYGDAAVIRGVNDATFRSYVEVVAEFARRLTPLPRERVALELMNEPRLKCTGSDQDIWNAKLDAMIGAARSQSRDLALVVTGSCISAIQGLLALDPKRWSDPALIYTFHYYEPFFFTHQGAPFIRWPEKHLGSLPWPPARGADQAAIMAEAEKSIATLPLAQREVTRLTVERGLGNYFKSNASRRLIERRLGEVAAWADRNAVARGRIFIGEFGVYGAEPGKQGALCTDRTAWVKDVTAIAQTNGFGWSFFHYDGPFGVADHKHGVGPMLNALGLRPSAAGC